MTKVANLAALDTAVLEGYSFRNKIINGDGTLDQRNNGSSVTLTNVSSTYFVDRWCAANAIASTLSVSRGGTSGAASQEGFTTSIAVNVVAAVTPTTSQYYYLGQNIEGRNVSDLRFGTVEAKAVTISFYAYSTITGTYALRLTNEGVNRSYVTTYQIPVANTWTKVFVTIPGDVAGTWNVLNGLGLSMTFDLGNGPSYETSTPNTWIAGDFRRTASCVRLVSTLGAQFAVTGVQLERGVVATPFERRPYGIEFLLCQRYFETGAFNFTGYSATGAGYGQTFPFAVVKRAVPTMTTSGATITNVTSASLGAVVSGFYNQGTITTTGVGQYYGTFYAAAEL